MFWQASFAHGVPAVLAHFERAFKWLAAEAAITTREQMATPSRFNECDFTANNLPFNRGKTVEIDFSFSKIPVC